MFHQRDNRHLPKVVHLAVAILATAAFFTVARAEEVTVKIDNFTFTPETLAVKPGTTVKWTNADDIPHTVTSAARGVFKSKALDTDDSYSFTFQEPGTFEYFCSLHPHMTATVTVEGKVGEAAPGAGAKTHSSPHSGTH
jgi:plastocyanin